ncbi:MAG: 16S rRNA (guanine(966)-N(2))-methyltransferase RsmD [Proteobacteria bacterium]|nr:16S rRNA (guanine(966)-N(2))-methyltransferase RsmD [Pseudomonadota bacterium]
MPAPTANRVRVIGGRHRGRVLRFPAAPGLRPTPDRVRETLFNWLGQDLTGATTLDPFAGTGALSLEALSRGATRAVAVERQKALAAALRANADAMGMAGLELHVADAYGWLAAEPRVFDVVFLDPPFAEDRWAELLPRAAARLATDGALYAESARVLDAPPGLALVRTGKAGAVHYHLFRRATGS